MQTLRNKITGDNTMKCFLLNCGLYGKYLTIEEIAARWGEDFAKKCDQLNYYEHLIVPDSEWDFIERQED